MKKPWIAVVHAGATVQAVVVVAAITIINGFNPGFNPGVIFFFKIICYNKIFALYSKRGCRLFSCKICNKTILIHLFFEFAFYIFLCYNFYNIKSLYNKLKFRGDVLVEAGNSWVT